MLAMTELIKVQLHGKTYYGTYRYSVPMVHVISPFGSKSAPRGSEWPKDLAERLLREIITTSESASPIEQVKAA
jgi:hypothetical protein